MSRADMSEDDDNGRSDDVSGQSPGSKSPGSKSQSPVPTLLPLRLATSSSTPQVPPLLSSMPPHPPPKPPCLSPPSYEGLNDVKVVTSVIGPNRSPNHALPGQHLECSQSFFEDSHRSNYRLRWGAAGIGLILLAARQAVSFVIDVGEESWRHIVLLGVLLAGAALVLALASMRAEPKPCLVIFLLTLMSASVVFAFAPDSLPIAGQFVVVSHHVLLPIHTPAWQVWETALLGVLAISCIAVGSGATQSSLQEAWSPIGGVVCAYGGVFFQRLANKLPSEDPVDPVELSPIASQRDIGYRVDDTVPDSRLRVTDSRLMELVGDLALLADVCETEARPQHDVALLREVEAVLLRVARLGQNTLHSPTELNRAHSFDSGDPGLSATYGMVSLLNEPHQTASECGAASPESLFPPPCERDRSVSDCFSQPRRGSASPHQRRSIVRSQRQASVTSDTNSHGTNYVSFVASLSKKGEDGPVGFSLVKRNSSGSQSSNLQLPNEEDDDYSPNDQRRKTRSLRANPRKQSHVHVSRLHSAGLQRTASVTSPTAYPGGGGQMGFGFQPPSMYGEGLTARRSAVEAQAKEVTESTRALVQKVMNIAPGERSAGQHSEGAHPQSMAAAAQRAFRNLPVNVLQKLILLFGTLNEELDTFRAQQFVIASVCEIVQCDRASIFLTEWKRNEIWTITNEGHEIRVPMEKSLAGWAALHNEVLNIKDAQNDKRFNTDVDKQTGYVTRNMLVYPISRGGHGGVGSETRPIAVIQAINKQPGFTSDDEGLLALMGKQAGIHLANSTLYNQLQLEGKKSKTLLEVTKEITDVNVELESMMERIMMRARQVLTVERATLFLLDEHRQELWSALTDAETADKLRDGGEDVPGAGVIRVPVGIGLAGHVAVKGEVLNIPDAYKHEMFNPEYDRKTGFKTRSILVVPIKVNVRDQVKVMGVIQLINKVTGDPFSIEDEELAVSFSSFVGISLNNIIHLQELREGKLVREQNKELKKLREAAEQAAEAKGNFLMSMSHEIRTPMGGVIGMCELLANTPLTAEQQEMLDTIRNCGDALLNVINDILDYGKIGSGKLELEKREFQLVSMLEETVDVIRSKIEAKAITLTLEAHPDLCPLVVGDMYRLRQIIINLVGNAVKFTPTKGSIYLAITPGKPSEGFNMIRFSVKDTGIGISSAAQKRLFQPFEQAEVGTTRQYGGTGLGLAICKQLVDAMSGEIGIISELGEGTEFWFTVGFGIAEGEAARQSLKVQLQSGQAQLKRLKMIAICSHAEQAKIVSRLCQLLEVKLQVEGNLQAAERLLEGQEADLPEVLMVDESAEGADPDSLAALLSRVRDVRGILQKKEPPRRLEFALMTSMATKVEQGPSLMEAGVSQILAKPPKQAQFLALLRRSAGLRDDGPLSPKEGNGDKPKQMGSQKLLVAEDNATNQMLITKQLKGFGIVPTICENGQVAVDRLQAEWHDLVFMDCHMPVLDGYGASRKIRELEKEGKLAGPDGAKISIVALTADALPNTRSMCLENGMDDYATKPLRKQMLSQVLDKYWFKTT
eukprot:Hpha_TRINITY_DN15922_c1_g3::TRINITY_DN15922_c1_g3_i1::g.71619::m.71619